MSEDEYTRGWKCGRQTALSTICEDVERLLAGDRPLWHAPDDELGDRYRKIRERVALLVQIEQHARKLMVKGERMAQAALHVVETVMKGRNDKPV